ncbi:histone-lysine N-methyltransferase SETDB2-like isoform X1 [Seriola lalandi dorsalis]|uniref:Histone-lysine N-methyltransferase SETDB2 n=1 Tax=Seriola lalandi dorsalis TaxID=1841481 RepID=A0A3B4XUA6_SERLL|nr:histone-lysine N-methyltransferase SETDB2-like isoform X1 [Seriola lalandi dorsalis]
MFLSPLDMEEEALDAQDVERAKAFWAGEDVDQAFDGVFEYLNHLKRVLKKNTATDKELVQALKVLETLDLSAPVSSQDASVVQVVIGSGQVLLPADFSHRSPPSPSFSSPCTSPAPPSNSLSSSSVPPPGRDELLPPLLPVQLQYQPHPCCKACLPSLSSMPQCAPPFWGQNPLKAPLLCGFKRLSAMPLASPRGGGTWDGKGVEPAVSEEVEEEAVEDWDVVYKAPCGQSLRNHDDVMRFLLASESYDVLQVDFFTFNPSVRLDPPVVPGPRRPELDLSRGSEPTPVELCGGDGGARPADFRYRRDRWPHGCFLSRSPMLFDSCCDCTDGCTDAQRCTCIAMTRGGRSYTHHRLTQPVASGLYECGPWCSCDRARCQNRLVQRGIRIRLQVFQTEDRGWGVRCRDDLDRGTFVCIYAGVILQRVQSPAELPPPKLTRAELPSDDEVEVVTEWLAPPVLEGRSKLLESPPPLSPPNSPPLHVPVIQRPADSNSTTAAVQDRDKGQTVLVGGPEASSPSAGDQSQSKEKNDATPTASPAAAAVHSVNGTKMETKERERKSLKRAATVEDVYFLDASKEGNVSRFINHSCRPNLFIQNVFTDTHDPGFPVIAFFTNRVVKAGTELTWNFSSDTQTASLRKQEVPCLCGSDGCRGQFTIKESLCDVCEVKGQEAIKAK